MSESGQSVAGYAGWSRWIRWPLELSALVLVFFLLQHWQTRNLLPVDDQQSAPALRGALLDGNELDNASFAGRPTLVYFFAPWCRICAFSASSLQAVREAYTDDELGMVMVALSYDSVDAVRRFADEHQLSIPILLGDDTIAAQWSIYGFPTYYVLDREGHVASRDFGVSTTAGLRLRVLAAK